MLCGQQRESFVGRGHTCTCAAGLGVSHQSRSQPWHLLAWRAAAAVRPPAARFSSATNLFSGSTKISLAPIVGAPQPIAEQFTHALVVAGKDRHLTILPAGAGSGSYTLRGYLLASSEKGGSKISYIWDVNDAKGNRVARVSGDELVPGRTADPWDNVNGTVLNSIAGKTTSQLAASLPNGSSKPVAAVSSESPAVPATAAPAADRRHAPTACWWLPCPALRATAALADHGLEEAALCRRH